MSVFSLFSRKKVTNEDVASQLKAEVDEPNSADVELTAMKRSDLELFGASLVKTIRVEREHYDRRRFWRRAAVLAVIVAMGLFFVAMMGGSTGGVTIEKRVIENPVSSVLEGKTAGRALGSAVPVVAALPSASSTGHIVVIKLFGPIDGFLHGAPNASNTPLYLDSAFRTAEEDPNLAGIILEIESPGGSSVASLQAYRVVKAARERLAKRGIKVIAYTSVGAYSGGYFIAMGAEKFYADPGANVANIGSIIHLYNTSGVGKLVGVTENIIKSGPLKSTGSQWEELTPEQRRMLQESIDDSFEQFIDAVAEGRRLDRATLLRESQQTDGRTNGAWFSAKKALEKKLIDQIVPAEEIYGMSVRALPDPKKYKTIEFIEYKAERTVLETVSNRAGQLLGLFIESFRREMTHRDAPVRMERE